MRCELNAPAKRSVIKPTSPNKPRHSPLDDRHIDQVRLEVEVLLGF
jgi:hypothetical protein